MMKLATSPYLVLGDLPSRWRRAFESARDRREEDEIMELGRAEIFMHGLRGCIRTA